MILDYVAKKHPQLIAQLPGLVLQYRQYMFLIALGQFKSMSVPSDAVDQIWHAHILHTVHYADFCQNVAGHFVHHNPFGDNTSQMERQGAVKALFQASHTIFGANVFAPVLLSADCGSCAGCSSCAGSCGGTACGGAGGDIHASIEVQTLRYTHQNHALTTTVDCGECSKCSGPCGA